MSADWIATSLATAGHALLLLISPIFVVGIINRVKSRWGGRVGPSLHQSWFDLVRLLRKRPVQSTTASWFVQLGPIVLLASTLLAGALTPLAAGWAPVAFDYDFVAFAYLLGVGRLLLVLAALDTGSAFEGMGASREAQYATFVEPAFFLAVGSLAALSGETSFAAILSAPAHWTVGAVVARAGALVALFVMLQVEAARVPVDDPQTHLELTMIHEVMILDHSGPDLAAVQYSAALKLTLCAAVIAALLSPVPAAAPPWLAVTASLLLIALVAALVGLVESLIARFRLLAMPRYLLVAVVASLVSLGVVALTRGPLA